MRVLLTGATGFVGRRLVRRLHADAHDVVAVVRTVSSGIEGEQLQVAHLSRNALRGALAGRRIDAVVNLAAAGVHPADRDPEVLTTVNAHFPAELVTVAAECGARAFIQIGSSAEYACLPTSTPISESFPLESGRLYGTTKVAGTLLAQAWGAQVGLPVAVLRLFNVFGPGEAEHRLLPSLVRRLLRSEAVPLSVGTQVRDFMHVDEACDAIVLALTALAEDSALVGAYNVATGQGVSVREFAMKVGSALRTDPALLQFGALPLRPDDLPFVVGDPAEFGRKFGWFASRALQGSIVEAVDELIAIERRS
jgi:nucleoside-diphosphate-sugar epimerase